MFGLALTMVYLGKLEAISGGKLEFWQTEMDGYKFLHVGIVEWNGCVNRS